MKPRNFRLHWLRCYCLLWLHPGRDMAVLAFKRRNMGRPRKVKTNGHGQIWIISTLSLNDRAKARIWSRTPLSRIIS